MNFLSSSVSKLTSLVGFSATKKLNHSNVEQNQRKEESILEEQVNENSNTEKGTEQDGTEVIIETKEELNIFAKLIKIINYFHARRRKYCEPNFTAWLTKHNNPQLGDGFAFNTLEEVESVH